MLSHVSNSLTYVAVGAVALVVWLNLVARRPSGGAAARGDGADAQRPVGSEPGT